MAMLALSQGNKIEAIKAVREQWGVGLKEAKDSVDAYVRTRPDLLTMLNESSAATQRGCVTGVAVLIAVGIAIALYFVLR